MGSPHISRVAHDKAVREAPFSTQLVVDPVLGLDGRAVRPIVDYVYLMGVYPLVTHVVRHSFSKHYIDAGRTQRHIPYITEQDRKWSIQSTHAQCHGYLWEQILKPVHQRPAA